MRLVAVRLNRRIEQIGWPFDETGGIAADRLPWVFDQFWHGSDEHAEGGLGLGLTLVKSLVELHGGSVEARSDGPGAGTEIIVYLPTWSGG